jgi:hypothetical protein
MAFKIFPINFIMPGLILLPNIFCMIFPPMDIPAESKKPKGWNAIIVLEWIGRLAVFILPLFWELRIIGWGKVIILIVMIFCILVYYISWLRYFIGQRKFKLLFKTLFFIPVPMAIFPVLYLILAGVLLNSWPVVLAAVIFASGHIPESLRNYNL